MKKDLPGKKMNSQYPGLETLSFCIAWLEQLLAILSEPFLIACASLAAMDFVTGGKLLAVPIITYIWAGSLAVAVSACFIVTWRRAITALAFNNYGAAAGLGLLGLVLGVVDWSAVDVQSLQQTLGISLPSALAMLGLNIALLTHLRAAVAISMAVVVSISNHTAVTTAQAPRRRVVLFDRILNQVAPVVSDEIEQSQLQVIITQEIEQHMSKLSSEQVEQLEQHVSSLSSDYMSSEQIEQSEQERNQLERDPEQVLKQIERDKHRLSSEQSKRLSIDDIAIERVREVLSTDPGCSDRELGRQAGLAPATAKKYRLLIAAGEYEHQVNPPLERGASA